MTPLKLIPEFWKESDASKRCPYVSYDGRWCYCISPEYHGDDQRLPCGTASLQFWCPDDYKASLPSGTEAIPGGAG